MNEAISGNTDQSDAGSGERALTVRNLHKTFASGFEALRDINLDVGYGEIFALLGPNGAGKTTLISIICGLVNPGPGRILANGYDVVRQFRQARASIGLVPQELATDAFVSVWSTVSFSRGLFGKPKDPAYVEKVLRDLSLWDKRDNELRTLSGGMKRRVMIAKALVHEPDILFLDEPTAGVDVELRREMWALVRQLRDQGVTIILTTHYIEEAEDMADRIGVINHGELVLVEETRTLMNKLGRRELRLHLQHPLNAVPATLEQFPLTLEADGYELVYTYDAQQDEGEIPDLLRRLDENGIEFRDLHSSQSSLEEIFVNLVRKRT
jgi:ABC-2 type transport system ATP-binding protein